MKKLLLVLCICSFSALASVRVGILNTQKIISETKLGKSINKTLKKSYDSKVSKLKKEEASLMKFQKDFQKQSLVLSGKAKAKKENEFRTKMMAYQGKKAEMQKQMQKQELELKKPILEKLQKVVEEVSKKEKVDMTFEIAAASLVYVAEKVDLTDKIIKAFDKKHKK